METNIHKTKQLNNPTKKIIIRELLYLLALLVIILLSNFAINRNEKKIIDIEKKRAEYLTEINRLEEQIEQSKVSAPIIDEELRKLLEEARKQGASDNDLRELIDLYESDKKIDLKQALKDFVVTVNSGKYKTEDELFSKFPEFKNYDRQVLKEFVVTANSGKYKTEDELFSKFPEFSIPQPNGVKAEQNYDFVLKESDRKRLDSIVQKMISNKESDENIQWVVNDFKQKYGEKSVIPSKQKITPQEFAKRVKDKYPEYKDIEDSVLVAKIIREYPVYQNQIDFKEQKPKGASVSTSSLSVYQMGEELEKLYVLRRQLREDIEGYISINKSIKYIQVGAFILLGLRYLFYLIRWAIKNKLFKQVNNLFNRVKLSYVLELMIPVFFTLLLSLFIGSKHYTNYSEHFGRTESYVKYANELLWIFSLSFFLLTISEWIRRNKTDKSEHFIIKYLYIGLMLLVFILGIWFVKEFQKWEN